MKIVQAPHVVLTTKAKQIHHIDKTITSLIEEMKQTLLTAQDPEGVGLAAPQIGKSLQIFIARPTATSPFLIAINPEITFLASPKENTSRTSGNKLEGCLSLKDIWGTVKRERKLKLHYLDEKGKKHDKIFTGFLATIIQHEYDHLNGILFPKRVFEQDGFLYKSKKNSKGEMIFEEISL